MTVLALGLLLFIASHLIPTAPALKRGFVERLGVNGYRVLFSLLSLVSVGLIIWGYGVARADTVTIWEPQLWLRHVALVFMLPVFALVIASLLPGQLKTKIPHPLLMAVKIWAFAHLLANGDAVSMVLFGVFLMYGVYGFISANKRRRAGELEVSTGPIRNDYIAIGLGIFLYLVFVYWGHSYFIGVPIL